MASKLFYIILVSIVVIILYSECDLSDLKKYILNILNDDILNDDILNNDTSNNNGIYTAVIVEPRKHPALELVLKNFTSNLDERWNFIFYHGTTNLDYIMDIVNKLDNQLHRFTFINLNVENLTIADYSNLFYTTSFYDNIPTEMFLVFQTDSLICNKFKDNIYKFMDYDYVGAPWLPMDWNINNCSGNNVGNGGLSLRRKSKMLEILNNCNHHNQNEDFLFTKLMCDCKYNIDLKKPTEEEAMKFSIEHIYSPESFGIHKPWRYISQSISFCEGADELAAIHDYK
jgi:hypothetical protein